MSDLTPPLTHAEVNGKITKVSPTTMDRDDDCSWCSRTLRWIKGPVLLACSGSYCSTRCARMHAESLVPELIEGSRS